MYLRILALVFLAAVALAVTFVARIIVRSYVGSVADFSRTPSSELSRHPGRTGIDRLHEVRFPSREGGELAAWYTPARNGSAVILVHGTNADRASLVFETRTLAAAGIGVLALDLPGQGASSGRSRWSKDAFDALSAAVDWLSAREEVDSGRIGAFGISFGGFVAMQAAARDGRIRAVALASAPFDLEAETRLANSRWGALSEQPALWVLRRYRSSAEDIPGPTAMHAIAPRGVLLIGGELDSWVPPAVSQQLFDWAGEPKELWIVAGAGHGNLSEVAPLEYARRLTEFFGRHLAQPKVAD